MATNLFAPGKSKLIEPGHGNYQDEWDSPCNSNFGATDALVSGTTTINMASATGSPPEVTLVFKTFADDPAPWTITNAGQNLRLLLTGALGADSQILIPKGTSGFWFVDNQTTGAFSVAVKTTSSGSTGVLVPQGNSSIVFSDGTNVSYADSGITTGVATQLVPVGSILSFAATVAPSGYLLCDGAAVSRTTYSRLFNVIGTTWGGGDGSSTFNVPDLADYFQRGASSASGVATVETDTYKNHSHPVTDPGHTHSLSPYQPQGVGFGGVAGNSGMTIFPSVTATNSATTGISVDDSTTGGTETRPKNKRVLFIIKT